MRALHVSFLEDIFYLWGEEYSSRGSLEAVSPRTLLASGGLSLAPGGRSARTRTGELWLPFRGEAPVPSSPLLGDLPEEGAFGLEPRQLPVLPLRTEDLGELQQWPFQESLRGSGLLPGTSLFWLSRLMDLVERLLRTENFFPGLVEKNSLWRARWLPLLPEHEERRLDQLVQAIPGSLGCLTLRKNAPAPPEMAPTTLAKEMLQVLLDTLIRQRIAPVSGTSSPEKTTKPTNLHDAWLGALQSPKALLPWNKEEEIRIFARELDHWSLSAQLHSRSAFRFCLRLGEPENPAEDSWEVSYHLQPKEDPSLLFSLEELWKNDLELPPVLARGGKAPRHFILGALGQAARLCPEVAATLEKKNPGGFTLDASGAFQFLQHHAPALQRAGFSLQLPSWWVRRESALKKISLTAQVSSPPKEETFLGLNSLLEFRYVLSLGGEELSREEIEMLADLKAPLMKIRGQWVEITQEQIRSALDFLRKKHTGTIRASELLAPALGGEGPEGLQFGVERVETRGWFREMLEELKNQEVSKEQPLPQTFRGTLRHYQKRGYAWLEGLRQWGLGACLADDMGLGKTVQALAFLQRRREAGEKNPALLICPTSVVSNWRKEAERFTPELPVLIHHGTGRHGKKAFSKAAREHGLVISSFGLLTRDYSLFREVSWSALILDEAQNIKNSETKQSKAARGLEAPFRLALTGTPVENQLGDLWTIMDFLNPGLLGPRKKFHQRYQKAMEPELKEARLERLQQCTAPFILRRLKTDRSIISDLPEKIITREYCMLTKEQASLYQSVLQDMEKELQSVSRENRSGLVLATLTSLKQICNHPAQFLRDNSSLKDRSGKLERLLDISEELRQSGERGLIFTQYQQMGALLQQHLQEHFGEEVFFLHGGVPRKKRDAMVERFQEDPEAPRLFVLSLKAGGTGLTLTRANHVIHYDRWWNPAVENQATDRAFRIGQKKNVQVHTFLVPGTLEENIDSMLEKKRDIAEKVIGTEEIWLGNLPDEELTALLRLDPEASGG